MRKVLYTFTLVFVLILTLSSCGDEEHTHEFGEWAVTKNSICTVDGTEERTCSCGEKETKPINALGHTEVIDSAVAATCTTDGKTEGKHCSVCNETLVAQNTVDALGHTEVIDSAVTATCTTEGKTEGKHCSICNKTLVAQTIVPASHQYSSNYEHDDYYHWLKCSTCGNDKNKTTHIMNDENTMCLVCNPNIQPTEGVIYDISADGTYAEVIGYEGTATNIKIAESFNGLSVREICNKAFYENKVITNIVIPSSVINIGDEAFYHSDNLSSIVIPDSVLNLGSNTFTSCYNLKSVIIGDGVRSVGYEVFFCCFDLESVIIGDGVKDFGWNAFGGCSNLTSVVMGENVQTIDADAFSSCDNLNFNKYGNCKYLGTETNPYFALIDTTNDNYNSYKIHPDTKIIAEHAFLECSQFSSITIPNGIRNINSYAFSNCSSLTSIYIPNTAVSVGESVFQFCDKLKFNEYSSGKYLGSEENPYVVLIYSGDNYNSQIHPDTRTIASYAFMGTYINKLVIPDGVEIIGDGVFSFASLESIVIPDSITIIGGSLYGINHIYYTGTKEQWDAISKQAISASATIHYNYVP